MRWLSVSIVLLLVLVAFRPAPAEDEVSRLRSHFRQVERELLARDVSRLTPAQREARARHVQVLREYRESGVFPHNHDFPGERRPYFVDRHGTLCAMAYLIARSGHGALVERIAATRNNAYLPELADDPELAAWLERSGLSLQEAARIQPSYSDGEVDVRLARNSAVMLGIEGATIAWNLLGSPERGAGWLSGLAGLAAGGVGFLGFSTAWQESFDSDDHTLGRAHLVAAPAAALAGAWQLGRWMRGRGAERERGGASPEAAQLSGDLWIGPGGEPGVAVRLRF